MTLGQGFWTDQRRFNVEAGDGVKTKLGTGCCVLEDVVTAEAFDPKAADSSRLASAVSCWVPPSDHMERIVAQGSIARKPAVDGVDGLGKRGDVGGRLGGELPAARVIPRKCSPPRQPVVQRDRPSQQKPAVLGMQELVVVAEGVGQVRHQSSE
jgi:hypothetical protein